MIDLLLGIPVEQRRALVFSLFPEVATLDEAGRRRFLLELLDGRDLGPYRDQIAGEMVAATRMSDVLPGLYADFRPMVEDGARFLLSRLSLGRLCRLIVEQALLPDEAMAGQRLQSLARQLPTLHKLGQIIARNPEVDPGFRQWLRGLESGLARSTFAELRDSLLAELAHHPDAPAIVFDPEPLAEASVGVVIGFRMPKGRDGQGVEGVAKLIKPGVPEQLEEEIRLIDELAAHFDVRRNLYPLRNFGYARVFAEVKESLRQEVDLAHEQRNLTLAGRFFADQPDVHIPSAFSWSTGRLTLMTRIHGETVDSSSFRPEERAAAARILFDALIGRSLFASDERALFHGDPHAGNLLLCRAKDGTCAVGVLDWSQAGHLRRSQRQGFLQLALGLATRDLPRAKAALHSLIQEPLDGHPRLAELEETLRASCDGAISMVGASQKTGLLARTLDLIDTLGLAGFAFPGELLWFRKSMFTLLGVLSDLDPAFDADRQLQRRLQELVVRDLPRRMAAGFNPLIDHPAGYRSFVSNFDLCGLAQHAVLSGVSEGLRLHRSAMHHSLERAVELAGSFWWPFSALPDQALGEVAGEA